MLTAGAERIRVRGEGQASYNYILLPVLIFVLRVRNRTIRNHRLKSMSTSTHFFSFCSSLELSSLQVL
jgi:hypothetical protein